MILGILAIATVIIITLLVASGVIKEKYYPYCIGLMALGLVYSTTLLGSYVVGSDIHGELFQARSTIEHGWNFANANSYSIVTIVIAPLLSQILQINIIWVFKAVLPLFLVGVPVILYFAFKAQFGAIRAYFASLFFIIMPIYFLEITQITKSMMAEFFYALAILAIVIKLQWQWKLPAILIFSVATVLCHYTIGIILICNLFGISMIQLATYWSKGRLFEIRRTPIWILPTVFIISAFTFYIFFASVGDGAIGRTLTAIWENMSNSIGNVISQFAGKTVYFTTPEPLVKASMGTDFMQQTLEGQIFRIVQYLTQLLIVIGAVYLLIKPYRYMFTSEFIAGIGCSFILLFLCLFLPGFSNIANLTRFYQASLFFLAPMLIVGIDAVIRIIKWALK